MMSTTQRIRRNKNGAGRAKPEIIRIKHLVSDTDYNTYNRRPSYQRNMRWPLNMMCSFIDTIMNGRHVAELLLYKLWPNDKKEHYNKMFKYEVIDGQHRLWTMKAFTESTLQKLPHIAKDFIVHWHYKYMDDNGVTREERVFYKETPYVLAWYKETYGDVGHPVFLTSDEKDDFDSFTINCRTYQNEMTLDERRQIFLDQQKGVPVRNADLFKNMTGCMLMSYFLNNAYEEKMGHFLKRCTKQATNYWTHWAGRCYLIYMATRESGSVDDTFLITDKTISKRIKINDDSLNPSEEEFNSFNDKFCPLIEFLQGLAEGIQFNPTQIFALFAHLCRNDCNTSILATHMLVFSVDGKKKEHKTLWENKGIPDERRKYFNDCLAQLETFTEPYVAIQNDERAITPKLRKLTFMKATEAGFCDICEKEPITMRTFEAGHILARKLGGKTEIENLLPMCKKCNKGMGTLDPYVYKKTVLPY